MAYETLDGPFKMDAILTEDFENDILTFVEDMEAKYGKHRWLSIARTDFEKGFMSLRKGISIMHSLKKEKKH